MEPINCFQQEQNRTGADKEEEEDIYIVPNQPVLVVDICLLFEGGFFLSFFQQFDTTRHDTLDEGRIKGGLCLVSGKKKGSRDWKK